MSDLIDSLPYPEMPLLAGAGFFEAIATTIFAEGRRLGVVQDFSAFRVIVPSMAQAVEIRHAMLNEAGFSGSTYLLPQFLTLEKWAESGAPNEGAGESVGVLRESERQVLLYDALRKRGWFDENALWEIAAEMCTLFDELTRASITLPADEAVLLAQLENAYALRSSLPLAFEARVVHETWRAVNFTGRISAIARYHLCLAKLAEEARASNSLNAPTFALLTDSPEKALSTAERDFFAAYATYKPLTVFYPCSCHFLHETKKSALLDTLAAAWPEELRVPILARAEALVVEHPISPLADGLQLIACDGAEQEAQAVVAQVGHYVNQGTVRIALIAQDRLTARRVRALLEREKMLINDESGWKLSTSRAAATLDALLETVTGGAYYQDFLDLLKSPFVFAHLPLTERRAVIFAVESAIRRASIKGGYKAIAKCVVNDSNDISIAQKNQAAAMINAIESAATCLRADFLSIADWLDALQNALQQIGALSALAGDAAGQKILDRMTLRRVELKSQTATFSRDAWRDWLNRELESAYFKDTGISSPVVMTSLKSALLRRFDAAILIGGDATRLVPAGASSTFFNTSVRRELGLSTSEDVSLCRDLELLLCFVPRVAVTWQRVRDGEANLLAPALDRLSLLHRLAWQDDLKQTPLPARPESAPGAETRPARVTQAAPFVPVAQVFAYLPSRVSVSAYKSLVDCPYLFFARYILGLGELDEAAEKMEKRDYGELVHRVLEVFHQRHPRVSALPPEEALAELRRCVDEVFAPVIRDDFLSIAWKFRWEKKLDSYLAWQRERETEGWRFFASEQRAKHFISLDDGSSLELYGRIDRIDKREWRNSEQQVVTEAALYDYKAQSSARIQHNLKDDIQLPMYTLFEKDAVEASYVALDSANVEMKSSGADQADLLAQAKAQEDRLRTCFSALRQAAPLPAQGIDAVCAYCMMSGLCRRDHVC